jgi:hypothetical protein
MTNMSVGLRSSFWTPEGAMKRWLLWRMEVPPPVPVTWGKGVRRGTVRLGGIGKEFGSGDGEVSG